MYAGLSGIAPVFNKLWVFRIRKSVNRISRYIRISCEEGYRKLSMEFGNAVRKLGYLVVWTQTQR